MTYALITVADVPEIKGDPTALSEAAGSIKTAGSSADTTTASAVLAWGGLNDENYDAPESPAVKASLPRLSDKMETVKTNLASISTALDAAATSLSALKTARKTLVDDVTEFAGRAESMQQFVRAGGSMDGEHWSTWRDVPGLDAENTGLWLRVEQLETDLLQIETDLVGDVGLIVAPNMSTLPSTSWTAGKEAGSHAEVAGPGASSGSYAGYQYDGKNHQWVAGAEAEAHLFQANAIARADNGAWGSGEAGASIDIGAKAMAQANASVGLDGIHGLAQASASAGVNAEAHAGYELGVAEVNVGATGMAGAEADVNLGLDIGADGLSASAGGHAFAGAKAGLNGDVEAMGVKGSVGADVRAGIGIDASADLDIGPDKIGIKLDLGFALGVGAGVKVDLSFSPKELVEDVKKLWPF